MKDIINGLIERFRRQHVQARRYVAMMLVLALLTTLFVNWQLHGVGITMTADYHCGYEEHQHTAACYEKVLTCGYEEGEPETPVTSSDSSADLVSAYSAAEPEEPEEPVQTEPETIWVPHEHTDACYEEHRVLTCYQEEHEHTDDCFDEYGALICGEFEHIHDDSCYTTEYELVCGLDEGELVEEPNPAYQEMPASRPVVDLPPEPAETTPDEPVLHHHTDACYTEELVCTIPEHHHTVECLADTQADVETAEEWQAAANVALNGNWAEDLLTVAKSQLDYQQSDKNFKLDVEDQQVLRGYSRYGAWYGNPYGAWDVMFLSYCLHFAGVPQTVVPQRAGVMALHSDLRGSQWLTDADGSTARPGDIVIYNTLTTEQVAVDESSYGIALLDLDEDPDTAAQLTASEPQVDTRTVTTETVGVVSAVDPDAGTLTVISGNVDGKVAEVPAAMSDVTSVISVTGAYAAETTAVAPEDPAGSQEELDGSYALLEDEDGFGATVDWVGDADPYGIALLAAGDPYDLSTWITAVNYEKTTDGKTWTPIGAGNVTVESGTHVRVNLKYTVTAGVLTPDHNTLTYQLPKGLPMPDVTTGNIVDESDKDEAGNAKVVGSFTVDTNGTVTLTFTDRRFIGTDDKGGLTFIGTFKAAVTASADSFDENKKIEFKDGCTLTIEKKTADIKISKGSGSPLITNRKDGTFVNNYKVTVETTNGTKDPVILTDTLNTNRNGENRSDYLKGGKYLESSFKLYKVDASGTKTEIDVPKHELKTDGNGNPQVVLAPLPALEAGEKYIWNYDVQRNYADFDKMPNGVAIINNTVKAEAGDNVAKADAWYTCKTPRIEKNGQYDPKTGHIQWTITVKIPHSFLGTDLGSYMLQGCKITDSLPTGVQIVGDVKVGNTTISAEEFQKNGYTIPADYRGKELTITFETTTPLGGGSVTNTAQIETKSKHTFEASDTVKIGKGAWTLSKELSSSSKGLAKWDISAANAAGESSFTLVETLQDAVNESGQTQLDTHYAYAAELDAAIKANLTLTMHDNTTLSYQQAINAGNTIEITYYSGIGGGGIVTANDPTTHVCSFAIKVTAGNQNNPVRSISVTGIPTHEERDDVPTGEVWTYKNTIHIQGVSGEASDTDTYRSYKQFEKGVAAKSSGDETSYLTGSNSFELSDLSGNNLHYQLVLQTSADDRDEITVTDTLPKNVGFKVDNVKIALDEGDFVKIKDKNVDWATATYDETTRQLTIKIRNYNQSGQEEHRIRIQYEVSVSDDPTWKNPSVGKLIYTNTATWGELTQTTTTTVTRKVEQVKKTGWQDSGNDRKLHYQVVINPAGEDLSAGQTKAEKIELWDNISTTNGAIATGDINSVKLYYYDYDETVGVTTGKEVKRNMYRILEADKNGWLHMEIPNMAALILVYDCNVKDGSAADSYQVSNTVTLSNGSKSSDSGISYQVKADATATTAQFVLRKKDSYSGVSLKGAEFTIYQYNKETSEWTKWTGNSTGTLTTDENGQASLAVLDSEAASCLKPDVLYKLVETEAPTDYQLDATPHYLLFRKNASAENEQQAFAKATGVAEGTTILIVNDETVDLNRNVQVGSDAGTTTAEYSNVYSKLTVSKLWLDQDTKKPVEPAVDSIHIEVWRYTDNAEDETFFAEADLDAGNNWTATWSGTDLPPTDGKGNAYYYLVKETTTGNWNVYIDNNGVQTGNITIQNRVYTGYELPSTGGMGTAPFGVLGGALAAAAALLLVRKRKQNEEE